MIISIPGTLFQNQPTLGKICGADCGLWDIVSLLLPNLIVLAGVIFFLLIIYYGWRLIQVAGSEIGPQQIHKAQQAVSFSVLGFLLVVSAYFILQILVYTTGVNFFTPPIN